jgi:ubiquitin-conjugating enzyme
MSVRSKRLRADEEMVRRAFGGGSGIRLVEAAGDPPERYRFELRVRGLVVVNDEVVPRDAHLVEVYLTLGYPRQAPQCRMLTPVFHPNIAPHAICIGDHWSAGQSLVMVVQRIAEMLAFQSYNVKSPLNGAAARWAEEHAASLPIDARDLTPVPLAADAPLPALPVGPQGPSSLLERPAAGPPLLPRAPAPEPGGE